MRCANATCSPLTVAVDATRGRWMAAGMSRCTAAASSLSALGNPDAMLGATRFWSVLPHEERTHGRRHADEPRFDERAAFAWSEAQPALLLLAHCDNAVLALGPPEWGTRFCLLSEEWRYPARERRSCSPGGWARRGRGAWPAGLPDADHGASAALGDDHEAAVVGPGDVRELDVDLGRVAWQVREACRSRCPASRCPRPVPGRGRRGSRSRPRRAGRGARARP